MSGSSVFHIILNVTFMVFLFGGLCEALPVLKADIINDIGPNVQLGLHCKSKHEDLGAQSLAPHQHWGFGKSLEFWGTTLFFCHFQWGNQSKWFNILDGDRDKKECDVHPCVWSIRPSGPCKLTGHTQCFPWNDQY